MWRAEDCVDLDFRSLEAENAHVEVSGPAEVAVDRYSAATKQAWQDQACRPPSPCTCSVVSGVSAGKLVSPPRARPEGKPPG